MGQLGYEFDPGQKHDPAKSRPLADAINWSNAVVPGFHPVLVKGIQAALTRRSDPPLTKLALCSPGAGMWVLPHPCLRDAYKVRNGVVSGPLLERAQAMSLRRQR